MLGRHVLRDHDGVVHHEAQRYQQATMVIMLIDRPSTAMTPTVPASATGSPIATQNE